MDEMKPNAETYRLTALTKLAKGNIDEACIAITTAKELSPDWKAIRFAAAAIDFYSALSKTVVPNIITPWPEPTDIVYVKKDSESIIRLREAANIFKDLFESAKNDSIEYQDLQCWYLACLANDLEHEPSAIELCRNILFKETTNYRPLIWKLARNWDIDVDPSIKALENVIKRKKIELPQVISLIGCYIIKNQFRKGLKVLNEKKEFFHLATQEKLWIYWYLRCLLPIKDNNFVKNELLKLSKLSNGQEVKQLIREAKLSHNRQSADLTKEFEKKYKTTKDPKYLLEICERKARNKEWAFIVDNGIDLIEKINTDHCVRLVAIAAFNINKFEYSKKILDDNIQLFNNKILPNDLRQLRIRIFNELGLLPSAISEAEKLASDEPTVENLLNLAQQYFNLGDLKGVASIAQRFVSNNKLNVRQNLELSKILLLEDKELSKIFFTKSKQKGIPDELVAHALDIGIRLGLDDEMKDLFERLPHLVSVEGSGFSLVSLDQMIQHTVEWRKEQEQVTFKYRHSEIPIHIFADYNRDTLIQYYHNLLDWNKKEALTKNKYPIFIRYGGRGMYYALNGVQNPKLTLDVSSLILAHQLNILPIVENVFKPIFVEANLNTLLLQMKDKLQPIQPSTSEKYRKIKDLIVTKKIKPVVPSFPADSVYRNQLEEMQDNWAALAEIALKGNGYLLDFLPLHTKDAKSFPAKIPSDIKNIIVDVKAIVETIFQYGVLTESKYLKAIDLVGELKTKTLSTAKIEIRKPLYCYGSAIDLLITAGILDIVCEYFDVFVETTHLETIDRYFYSLDRIQETTEWLNSLQSRLSQGLRDSSYKFLPRKNVERDKDVKFHQDKSCTNSLIAVMQDSKGNSDFIWIDDRKVNSYALIETIPIIDIIDILQYLRQQNHLTDAEFYDKLYELRKSDARYIPIFEEELNLYLANAKIVGKTLIENEGLKIIRQYFNSSILQLEYLNRPNQYQNVPNKYGETEYLITSNRSIRNALLHLWRHADSDIESLRIKSDWILENLFVNQGMLVYKFVPSPETDNSNYGLALEISGLITQAIDLPYIVQPFPESKKEDDSIHRQSLQNSPRKKYLTWLGNRLINKCFNADKSLIPLTAEILKKTLLSFLSVKENERDNEVTNYLIQKFYEDLPADLANEVALDSDFMQNIGYLTQATTIINNFQFNPNEFYKAAFDAINHNDVEIIPINSKEKIVFKYLPTNKENITFLMYQPSTGKESIIKSDLSGLLLESPIEREKYLRSKSDWFDFEPEEKDRLITDIVSTLDHAERISKTNKVKDSSIKLKYDNIFNEMRRRGNINYDDIISFNINNILKHLRLHVNTQIEFPISATFNSVSATLLNETNATEVFIRFSGLPVKLPSTLIDKLNSLSEPEFKSFLKSAINNIGSPLTKVHLINVLINSIHTNDVYQRLARKIINYLFSESFDEEFNAFKYLLQWVEVELGYNEDYNSLPSPYKFICFWLHTHYVYTIFNKFGIPLLWFQDNFQPRHIPKDVFTRKKEFWLDISHPRKLFKLSFVISALENALSSAIDLGIDTKTMENIIASCFIKSESTVVPQTHLLFNSERSYDSLGSFLRYDFDRFANKLRLPPNTPRFSNAQLEQLINDSLIISDDKKSNALNWTMLQALIGDSSLDADAQKKLKEIVLKTKFIEIYSQSFDMGNMAILFATQQSINILDTTLIEYLVHELKDIAAHFSTGMEDSTKVINKLFSPEGALVESVLNLSNCIFPEESRSEYFSKIMNDLCDIWPKLLIHLRPIIQHLIDELPLKQSKHLWTLFLKTRVN